MYHIPNIYDQYVSVLSKIAILLAFLNTPSLVVIFYLLFIYLAWILYQCTIVSLTTQYQLILSGH